MIGKHTLHRVCFWEMAESYVHFREKWLTAGMTYLLDFSDQHKPGRKAWH